MDFFPELKEFIQLHHQKNFLFGHNEARDSYGEYEFVHDTVGLTNVYYVTTKIAPCMSGIAFLGDNEFERNTARIQMELGKIPEDGKEIILDACIGVKRSMLHTKAPATYGYLMRALGARWPTHWVLCGLAISRQPSIKRRTFPSIWTSLPATPAVTT